ncbi:MAG TPA: hypothetical protein VEQ59_22185 [Polyangiaceae bacterium]|nr:hypothetical protein [Polyangiaceae bacterium]
MTSLATHAPSPTQGAAPLPHALVRLCSNAQKQLWALRLGRLYGYGIGFSYAVFALVAPASLTTSTQLWARCLATTSWVAGLGALSLATDLAARDAAQGLSGLARLRGFGEPQLERARLFAGALRLSITVLVPGLMLSLAALLKLRTLHSALLALCLAVLTLPYAALVGGVLAPLARASHRLLPGRGRLVFLLIVLGPWLVALGTGAHLPSIPAAFGWVLGNLARSFR